MSKQEQSQTRQAVREPDAPEPRPKHSKRKPPFRARMFQIFLLGVAILAAILVAAIASQADMVQPEPGITSELLREQLEYVRDLVTVEYHYTDADKQELPGKKLFDTIPIPWTKKAFIISYDGVIKYGVDVSQVGLSVNGITKTVTVEIPRAKIISHEIPEEGFRVLYESNGLFNKINIDDVTLFRATQKDKMETRAEELEMPQKAQEQSGEAISALLRAVPGMEDYSLEIEYAT
ncbi:MAG: DUF4230 domain-containing protein [Oscillibacter sp.]|nr:DUF4230 domain-containing protein [Oscillibacter sp.]